MNRSPHPTRIFTAALPLLAVFLFACEGADLPAPDAAPQNQPPAPKTGNVAPQVVTTEAPTVHQSCDDLAKDSYAWLPDDQLDALLGQFTGASCAGDLDCEVGQPQNCGPGFNVYSTHAIGCRCQDGKFSCRDYRAEARACGGLRSDGGTS